LHGEISSAWARVLAQARTRALLALLVEVKLCKDDASAGERDLEAAPAAFAR